MEASARKKKRPLAAIPENLEELSAPSVMIQIVAVHSLVDTGRSPSSSRSSSHCSSKWQRNTRAMRSTRRR